MAEAKFADAVALGGGGTTGDIVRRLALKSKNPARRKAARAALRVKDLPVELEHIYRWYAEIRKQTVRGFHFEPIQFSEIIAYRDLHELHGYIGSFETGMLTELDEIWRKVQPKPEVPDKGRKPQDRRGT